MLLIYLVNSGSELKWQYSNVKKDWFYYFFEKTAKPLIYAKDERRRTFIEGVDSILYKNTFLHNNAKHLFYKGSFDSIIYNLQLI